MNLHSICIGIPKKLWLYRLIPALDKTKGIFLKKEFYKAIHFNNIKHNNFLKMHQPKMLVSSCFLLNTTM